MGAIPWIILQLILVAVVIAWPESVTYWLGEGQVVDQDEVQRKLDNLFAPPVGGSDGGLPGMPPVDFGPPKIQ